jgi:23S rRNA pseudouridine2605 synthase
MAKTPPKSKVTKSPKPKSSGRTKSAFGDKSKGKPKPKLKPRPEPKGPDYKRTHLGLSAKRAQEVADAKENAPEKYIESNGDIRLNKYVANSGICSRREADGLIAAGVITVNGNVVTELGTKVSSSDDVRYDGQRINPEKYQYVLLNKPKDYITTMNDPQGRKTVMLLLKKACKERIFPVGRLDRMTTGLLLFTNDGDLAKKLTHPKHEVQKIYHVVLDQKVKPAHLKQIREGIELEDGLIQADDVAFAGDGSNQFEVGIEIHSGKNRIVRRIFEHFGYQIVKLDRVLFAGLTKKDLPRGMHRHLTSKEVAFLKMQVGKHHA